jgi:ClpX C4-type zinc finger protein
LHLPGGNRNLVTNVLAKLIRDPISSTGSVNVSQTEASLSNEVAAMKGITCSFCSKTIPNDKARGRVIAGSTVFICRECAEICIGVFASDDPEWRDLQIARLANEGCSAKTETIYVWLPEEGVDVFRPVTAQPLHDDLYRLIDAPPEGEVWEFQQGDTVRCLHRQLSGDEGKITDYLLAGEKAE